MDEYHTESKKRKTQIDHQLECKNISGTHIYNLSQRRSPILIE